MLLHSKLSRTFWAEAVNLAVDVMNRSFYPRMVKFIYFELSYGIKPRADHMRILGCTEWAFIQKETRKNLDPRS